MSKHIYVGAVSEDFWSAVREKTGIEKGFEGCIRKVSVNNQLLLDTDRGINLAEKFSNISKSLSVCDIG